MKLRKMSRRQKMFVLILGLLIVFFLIVTGKMFPGERRQEEMIANEELLILGTADTVEGLEKLQVYTDKGVYRLKEETDMTPYLWQSIQAVTEGEEILHINNLLQRQVRLENCLITENSEQSVQIFSHGFRVNLPCSRLTVQFENEIADITMTNGSVTKISTKKESICGKILSVRPDGIELEGYGIVPVTEKFRFYETYGNYAEKNAYGLVVGYNQARFIVAEGKICAAVLEQPISPQHIRVLLKTTGFEDIVHADVRLKAHGSYDISYNGKTDVLEDGQELQLTSVSEYLENERVIFTPQSSDARMEISSIERSMGTPSYAGSIEVLRSSGGLVVINELDIENYLYGVVPSEMPARYELEALKAQAVCARSYAYRQILENGYAVYGAHVDDSVSYQVYNNLPTDEKVIRAVDETAGKVLKFGDEVALTYYFSTSCGYTTNETIWPNGSAENSYLSGKLLNDSKEQLELSDENAFRDFILNENYETYDSGEAWYRWDMTVPADQLTDNVCQIENIGEVKNIRVVERNEGGVVQEVLVTGTKGELGITTEYSIRSALNGEGATIKRAHGKDVSGGKMLPSGFFVIDKIEEDGEVTAFRFRGGGFGHGAGMSQNGANHMAEAGADFTEILALFYEGTELADF